MRLRVSFNFLCHDTSMRFILQYVEFLILILRKVPDVVNTKSKQLSFHITPSAVNGCQGRMMA